MEKMSIIIHSQVFMVGGYRVLSVFRDVRSDSFVRFLSEQNKSLQSLV